MMMEEDDAAPPMIRAGAGTNSAAALPQIIDSMHADYIHSVAFSPYGRRLATSSGDRFVRVFDLTDSGDWVLCAQWQAHRGAVTCLAWAHPEFGALLATAGSDHDAKLWEERESTTSTSNSQQPLASRWTAKASLTEARRAVTCLEFAPRHWGLKLAVGSADGSVRIYEAVDIMNLAQWPLAATLQLQSSAANSGVTCLSWCNGRFEPPTLVAGGGRQLWIYRYSEAARAWQPLLQLPAAATPRGDVLDVAWAPNVGRRFHYIASAENQQLRVYKLLRQSVVDSASSTSNNNSNKSRAGADASSTATATTTTSNNKHLTLESSQTLECNAWRCEWNVTGTVLASSGDAGIVQLWKTSGQQQHVFECVSKVQGDLSQVAASFAASPAGGAVGGD